MMIGQFKQPFLSYTDQSKHLFVLKPCRLGYGRGFNLMRMSVHPAVKRFRLTCFLCWEVSFLCIWIVYVSHLYDKIFWNQINQFLT
jgi:hypothetical protein